MGLGDWWRNRGRDPLRFPEDENGDVLWQMNKAGDDLSQRRIVDFAFLFPAEGNARAFQAAAASPERTVAVTFFEEKAQWEALCSLEMIPTHRAVKRMEIELARLASPWTGEADGWGCMAQ